MVARESSLWRHSNFRRLWAAQTTSLFGSQVGLLALPLLAALTLGATPRQMGILAAIGALPALLLGPFAGVWVDRRGRLPLLIAADWGRAAILLAIPLAALGGWLRIELLYAVALGVGALNILFDVAHQSLLPGLVGRDRIIEGNSKLELGRTAAELGGPGIAGVLIQILTPPLAVAADALSYVASGLFLQKLRGTEGTPRAAQGSDRVWDALIAGFRAVFGNALLRPLAIGTATLIGFSSLLEAVAILFFTRALGLAPLIQGLVFAVGNVGFLVGAVLAERAMRRFGVGKTLICAVAILGAADLCIPALGLLPLPVVPLLIGAQFCFGAALVTFNINAISLRQSLTPDQFQGRTNASFRTLTQGAIASGALIGGLLGEAWGLRPTLLIGAIGELTALGWLIASPLRGLVHQFGHTTTGDPQP